MSEADDTETPPAPNRAHRDNPLISDALSTLDIIDAKVGVLIQFVGILIAAVLIFITGSGAAASLEIGVISFRGFDLIYLSLTLLAIAALVSLSCVWIINMHAITEKDKQTPGYVVEHIQFVCRSRRARYKIAYWFTFLGFVTSAIAIAASLGHMNS